MTGLPYRNERRDDRSENGVTPFSIGRSVTLLVICLAISISLAFWVRGRNYSGPSGQEEHAAATKGTAIAALEARKHPIRVMPTDRPLIPLSRDKLQWLDQLIQPSKVKSNVSDVLHVLRVHGLNSTPKGSEYSSGHEMLALLCDEEISASFFGHSAIVSTRYGARFPTFVPSIQSPIRSMEVHRDQCLAVLGELGVPLHHKLAINGQNKCLHDVLKDSIANFYIDQQELEWTAVAYGCYLPPARSWQNRFGETATFDDVATILLNRSLSDATCAGTHRLFTLTILLRIDREHIPIFSLGMREKVLAWLKECLGIALKSRSADGSWDLSWHPSVLKAPPDYWTPAHDGRMVRILATGHLAEWMLYLPEDLKVPDEVLRQSGMWCFERLRIATPRQIEGAFCPYSHCASVVRHLAFMDSEKQSR